jgi:DNA gyrase subunit B
MGREVGLLLIRSYVLGNEAYENRNGLLSIQRVRVSQCLWKHKKRTRDGAHIKNLFYTFIWNFCPDLIKDGYIYAGVPPLFKVTEGNGKSYKYLKDQAALDEYKASHTGKYVVGRMKGLGEMDPEEVAETLMDPENRIIHQISVEDEVKASTLFEQMMGSSPTPRKKFLKDYSEESYYVE